MEPTRTLVGLKEFAIHIEELEDHGRNLIDMGRALRERLGLPLPAEESANGASLLGYLQMIDTLKEHLDRISKFALVYRQQRDRLIPLTNEAVEFMRLPIAPITSLELDTQAEGQVNAEGASTQESSEQVQEPSVAPAPAAAPPVPTPVAVVAPVAVAPAQTTPVAGPPVPPAPPAQVAPPPPPPASQTVERSRFVPPPVPAGATQPPTT